MEIIYCPYASGVDRNIIGKDKIKEDVVGNISYNLNYRRYIITLRVAHLHTCYYFNEHVTSSIVL